MDNTGEKIVVTGAGGFIGHHLARFLKQKGYWVRGVDIKKPEYSSVDEFDEFLLLDLREFANAQKAMAGMDKVYALAANMGGIGFITQVRADVMRDNVLINVYTAEAAKQEGVKKVLYTSSACIYPKYRQKDAAIVPLKESDAYPADPEDGYGWEKLFSEEMYISYTQDYGLPVRIARYHNIFGPEGTYQGPRSKAPAELCRKVAEAPDGGTVDVWGDGEQTRSFCYIDDCLEGTWRLMESDFADPLNVGSDRIVTINEMVDIIANIAGKHLEKRHLLDKPQGVRGRNSDNTLCKKALAWEPQISLEEGLKRTYQWIEEQLRGKQAEI